MLKLSHLDTKMASNIKVNAFYNMLYRALSVLFPLVTAGYASRVLLADGIGKVSYAQSIVAYFLMFASMGIPNYGIREIAKNQNKDYVNRTFTEILLINTISTLFVSIIFYSLIFYTNLFDYELNLYVIIGLMLILNLFNVDWFFQGKEEYKYIAIRSLVIKVFFTILLFVFVKEKDDYPIYALLYCLATAGNYFFNIYHVRKYVRLDFTSLNIYKHIKPILLFFTASISIEIYIHLDTTMLGLMSDESSVGYYSNTSKLIRVISNSLIAIGAVIFPRVSLYFENGDIISIRRLGNRICSFLLLLSTLFMTACFCASKEAICLLFGSLFISASTTLMIQSSLIPIFTIAGGFATPILLATNQEKKYTLCTFIGLIIHLLLNLLLIPLYEHDGASMASVVSEFYLTTIQLYFIRNYIKMHIFLVSLRNVLIILLCSILVCNIFDNFWNMNSIISLIVKIVIISLIFMMFLIIIKDSTLKYIYSKIKLKI